MRFAIVGDCIEAVFAAEAIHAAATHEIQSGCVADALAAAMTQRVAGCVMVSSPEEAILDPECDAVLVAATNVDQSIALARQASQAGRHVVVVSPEDVSTAYSFELHLLLDESEKGIVPLSGRWYVDESIGSLQKDGDVQQISLSLLLSPADLPTQQLLGVDALCGCGFVFSQVTALDLPGADGELLSRSITLAASASAEQKAPPAVLSFTNDADGETAWIVARATGRASRKLTTALPVPSSCRDAVLQRRMLERITERLEDNDACQRGMEQFSNSLELMEGLQKSLRRRRTVDVHFDGVSERSAFKTQMTAIGCGVLTYLMFGLVAFLIVAQLATFPPWVLKIGRIAWITPLVLFLLAQFLLPLARERSHKSDDERG